MSRPLNIDPRLVDILTMPLEEAEAIREADLAAALAHLEQLHDELAAIPAGQFDRALIKRYARAAHAAESCTSRKAWLWWMGHRW